MPIFRLTKIFEITTLLAIVSATNNISNKGIYMILSVKKYTLIISLLFLIGFNLGAMEPTDPEDDVEYVSTSRMDTQNGLRSSQPYSYVNVQDSAAQFYALNKLLSQQAPAAQQRGLAERIGRRAGELTQTAIEEGYRMGVYQFTSDLTREILSIAVGTAMRTGANVFSRVIGKKEEKNEADEKVLELQKAILILRQAKEELALKKELAQELEKSTQLVNGDQKELKDQKEFLAKQQTIFAQEEQALREKILEAKKMFDVAAS